MIDLSIIIVSWNVRELLGRCLASAVASARIRPALTTEVIVVDNASSDDSAAMIARDHPQVRLISNSQNLGFTRASNQGIRASSGRYLLLLNPDTEVLGDALGLMVDYMGAHPQVGLLGPKLLNPDGTVQSSRRRFPTLATAFVESTVLQRYLGQSQAVKRYYMLDRSDDEEQEVDWLMGACLTARREAVAAAGLLDEGFFMYFEEVDWARRIRQAGWQVVYLPQAQVIHHHGQSSGRDIPHRHINFNVSKWRYVRKHHGPLPAMLLRWFLLATFVFQMAEEAAKLLLGHKRTLRRERLGVLARVLRSRLRP